MLLLPTQHGLESGHEIDAVELTSSRDAVEEGSEPIREAGEQSLVGEIGPIAGLEPPREADSVAECRSLAPPGQSVEAELAHAIQQRGIDRVRRRVRQWIVAQHQGAETLLATRQNRLFPRIPGHDIRVLDMGGENGLDLRSCEWRRQEDPRIAGIAVELGDGQKFLNGQRICRIQDRARSAGQPERARFRAAALCHPIGIGESHDPARLSSGGPFGGGSELPPPYSRLLLRALKGPSIEREPCRKPAGGTRLVQELEAEP